MLLVFLAKISSRGSLQLSLYSKLQFPFVRYGHRRRAGNTWCLRQQPGLPFLSHYNSFLRAVICGHCTKLQLHDRFVLVLGPFPELYLSHQRRGQREAWSRGEPKWGPGSERIWGVQRLLGTRRSTKTIRLSWWGHVTGQQSWQNPWRTSDDRWDSGPISICQ